MKLSIYENTLEKLKKGKLRIISGALILTTLLSFSGCKSEQKRDDTISINVIDEVFENKNGEYEYILNLDGIRNCDIKENYNKLTILKEVEKESYNNYLLDKNEKTDAFFNKYNYIIFPSCYEHHKKGFYTFNFENSKRELEFKKLEALNGDQFVLVRNSIEIKRNIDPGYRILTNGQKQFLKGDKLESNALIYNGEIIAFKQTGVGSECDNVIDIGNLDIALTSMDSILDEDINTNYKEAETMVDDMNKKGGKIK